MPFAPANGAVMFPRACEDIQRRLRGFIRETGLPATGLICPVCTKLDAFILVALAADPLATTPGRELVRKKATPHHPYSAQSFLALQRRLAASRKSSSCSGLDCLKEAAAA